MADCRHFLDLDRIDSATLRRILDAAARMKAQGGYLDLLKGKTLAMVFEKPSTRTRVSFEVAIRQLGGGSVILDATGSQLGRGETIGDTARVLSQYVDAIMLRTTEEAKLHEMAEAASVPVINGLTDKSHPCQIMADVMTFEETHGPIEGKVVAWSGDGNNVACSWIHAAVQFGFELRVASPSGLQPPARLIRWAEERGGAVSVSQDPEAAVEGADCVVTDTWISMGDDGGERRRELLAPFQVNAEIMARAKPDAIFMHCLPVYRDSEVTADVVDGPQSVIWTEAGNRLHAQKGVLVWCVLGDEALA